MALTLRRSDRFPIGTVVSAFSGGAANRHAGGRPSGAALATATVDAAGVLSFPALGEGLFGLWAEVNGVNVTLLAGSQGFSQPGTLKERIRRTRLLAGV